MTITIGLRCADANHPPTYITLSTLPSLLLLLLLWVEDRLDWVWRWLRIQARASLLWQGLKNQADPIQALASIVTLITVVWGVWSLVQGEGERVKQSHYAAWQVVNSAQGQITSGGRIDALQDLNRDHVSLVGLSAPRAYLRHIDLVNADLKQSDLSGADLVDSQLTGAYLNGAHLRGADLNEANLSGANLNHADLKGANLRSANLRGADLWVADLRGANLNSANLRGANLRSANLRGANLHSANLRGAYLSVADLTEADFRSNLDKTALDPIQVKEANHWEQAYYDEDFRQLLGLPPSILTPAPQRPTYAQRASAAKSTTSNYSGRV